MSDHHDRKPPQGRGDRHFGGKKPEWSGERGRFGDRKPPQGRIEDKKPTRSPRPEGQSPARREGPVRPAMDARKLALTALCDVTIGDAYSNIALDKRLKAADMSPEDRRLATNLFYTALEHRMYIDFVLGRFIDHMPEEKIVREILHIAMAQLLYMDRVPDYAAVNAAVNQIRAYNREQYAPLINGALRSVIRARDGEGLPRPDREANEARYLSIMHSLPETIVSRLMNAYGPELAEKIIAYEPAQRWETVRANKGQLDEAAFERLLAQRDWHAVRGLAPGSWRVYGAGDLSADPDYFKGLFSIQSESSMLAALSLDPRPGQMLLDACAAPGGKTALLAESLHDSGRVYAWDVHAHRVELIKKTAQRLRLFNVRPMECDAAVLRPEFESRLDGVLLDVPCTGLGVIYGKPDLKFRLRDQKVEEIAAIQKSILETCCRYVKPGGTLVYSTCTMLEEENGAQIAAFLEAHPEFSPAPAPACLPPDIAARWKDGRVQILPPLDQGLEGFFIAVMRRRHD